MSRDRYEICIFDSDSNYPLIFFVLLLGAATLVAQFIAWLRNVLAVIAVIFFIAQIIASIVSVIKSAVDIRKKRKDSGLYCFLKIFSSVIYLPMSYICLDGLFWSYEVGDGILDALGFLLAAAIVGCPYAFMTCGWFAIVFEIEPDENSFALLGELGGFVALIILLLLIM